MHDRVHRRGGRIEVRRGEAPPGQQHEVGRLAGREAPDPVAEAGGGGPTRRRHLEDLSRGGHPVVHAGHAVQPEHEPHLLEHVAVVVDARLVEPEADPHPAGLEPVQRGHPAPQPQVRARVVADHGGGPGRALDVVLGEPHPVAERHAWAQQPEVLEVAERGGAGAAARVLLLVGRLHQMHVQADVVLLGVVAQRPERLVRAPVEVGGGELHPGPLTRIAPDPLPEVDEEPQVIGQRDGLGGQVLAELRPQRGRQPAAEVLVGLVDQAVLVAERVGVGHAHADVVVGPEDALGDRGDPRGGRAAPAVEMLHRGDAGGQHVERGVERVEVGIDVAAGQTTREPQLERQVGRAELERGQPDVMMAVDEAGQDDVIGRAEGRGTGVAAGQLGGRPHLDDDPVALEERAVLDHRGTALLDPGDHVPPAHEGRGVAGQGRAHDGRVRRGRMPTARCRPGPPRP